jgi:pyridoxamine 5'-phosphate oxidase family protein
MFSEKDRNYLKSQRLARIATVSKQSQPDVAPVGYEFDGEYFYVGGRSMTTTFKYKNVKANPRVAIVVDDLESVDPWRPRGISVHGTGELVHRRGYAGEGEYIRIRPEKVRGWGIDKSV